MSTTPKPQANGTAIIIEAVGEVKTTLSDANSTINQLNTKMDGLMLLLGQLNEKFDAAKLQSGTARGGKKATTAGTETSKKPEFKNFSAWLTDKYKNSFDAVSEFITVDIIDETTVVLLKSPEHKQKQAGSPALIPHIVKNIIVKYLTKGRNFNEEMFAGLNALYTEDKKKYNEE